MIGQTAAAARDQSYFSRISVSRCCLWLATEGHRYLYRCPEAAWTKEQLRLDSALGFT